MESDTCQRINVFDSVENAEPQVKNLPDRDSTLPASASSAEGGSERLVILSKDQPAADVDPNE